MSELQFLQHIQEKVSLAPLWCQEKWKTKDGFLKWVADTLPKLETIHEERIRNQQNNLVWYLGEYDNNQEYKLTAGGVTTSSLNSYGIPVMVNHLYGLTEQAVSKEAQLPPNFEVHPSNDEDGDRISAKLMKPILDYVGAKNNQELIFQQNARRTLVFGEDFALVTYDPKFETQDVDGNLIGDVRIKLIDPFFVLYEPTASWETSRYVFLIEEILHVEEAKKKFKLDEITTDHSGAIFSFQTDKETGGNNQEEVIVYKFFHKPTPELPNGVEATIVGDKVVEFNITQYPYSHNKLPLVRRTAIDVPGRCFPSSIYKWAIPVQHQYNKMVYLEHKYISLCAHPKWMMQKGACDIKSLGNAGTVVQIKPGATFPQLIVTNPVARDIIEAKQDCEAQLDKIFGIQGVSRGTPPPGVRSNKMLEFYGREEDQRASIQIIKRNEFIREVYSMSASVVSDYYPQHPDRLIQVVGSNDKFELQKISSNQIGSNHEIKVQNSTGFPDSLEGKTEQIEKLLTLFPGSISPQQAFNIMNLNFTEKYYDIMTAALKSAEDENSKLMEGKAVAPPESYEDQIVHLEQHYLMMQAPEFKALPDAIKERAENHVEMSEMILEESIAKTPELEQLVKQKFPFFPVFWTREAQPEPEKTPGDMAAENAGMTSSLPSPEELTGMPMPTEGEAPMSEVIPEVVTPEVVSTPPMGKVASIIRNPQTGFAEQIVIEEMPING